jgi:hypothetical protein
MILWFDSNIMNQSNRDFRPRERITGSTTSDPIAVANRVMDTRIPK